MDSGRVRFSNRPLIRFLAFARPHLKLVIGAALMGIGKFTLPLAFPLAFKYVADVLVALQPNLTGINLTIDRWCAALAHSTGLSQTPQSKLAVLSISLLLLYALQSAASYYRNYWGGIAGMRLIFGLQCKLFSHLQKLPNSFFDRNPTGAIVSRVLNDVTQANEFVSSAMIDIWMDGISLVLVTVALFALDAHLALIALCIMPLWLTFMRYFSPRIKAVSHRMQQAAEDISGEVHERVAGAIIVKSFVREEHEARRFEDRSQHLCDRTIDKIRLAATQEMLIQLLTRSAPTIVIWAAALMIMRGTITLGTLIAFISYLGFLYLPLERFAQLSVIVSAALAAIERIFNFLDLQPAIADHPLSRPFPIRRGTVQFDNVSFAYPALDGRIGPTILDGINLHVPEGSRVALVGRSGAGKTTLASLIPRFYDASGGRVLIDGKDVAHYTLKALRQSISLVTQDALRFSVSIRDNLLYARCDATDEMLWKSVEMANIRDFVETLPQGIDTVIGERGIKISGGQRQRLALARAFLKDSRIIILDEATSAVDSESENLIHDAMERLMHGRTVFLIAHRLRSAINSDLIVLLDNGRVAEVGTHTELLHRGKTYTRLFAEQVRGLTLEKFIKPNTATGELQASS
jgi:ATP-binding cassette, subfamily B, putative efflux pump